MAGLLLALLVPAAAAAGASYSAALTLGEDGRLRVVETARPRDASGALCGPVERELPAKRLRLDGLRRLVPVTVASVLRGSGAGLAPAPWSARRSPRGILLRAGPAPAPPDCALTLVWEAEPLASRRPGADLLSFPLPGPEWPAALEGGVVRLAGPGVPARLVRRDKAGREVAVADGLGAAEIPPGLAAGGRLVFVAELPPGTLPAPSPGRALADNLHAAAGAAGLVLVALLYALAPSAWGRWSALAAGGALSAGTVAAMRLAEDPAGPAPAGAAEALGAGALAALAGAAVLACWALTALLTRSAARPDAPRRGVLGLAAVALGFLSFGATTWAADLFTRLVRDAAPAALACGAGHLLAHAAAFVLRRR